jgi:predicted phosphoribosyltransferase
VKDVFEHRHDAGRRLGEALLPLLRDETNGVVVLALPRGGVPVGFEVAAALRAPLDVFSVRKLGCPDHEELAFGAVATGGVQVMDSEIINGEELRFDDIAVVVDREREELERRERLYRAGKPPLDVAGMTVVLVDDGLATGATMLAAVEAVRKLGPRRVVAAVPVAPPETCAKLRAVVDELVCLRSPRAFYSVGSWYDDFGQTSDDEVIACLARGETAARRPEP